MAEKYVCFRVGDWDKFMNILSNEAAQLSTKKRGEQLNAEDILEHLPDAVADAEVFRHQDLVAAPILYAASAIYQSYKELLGDSLPPERQEYLAEVVDHFFEAAERSKGLPTHKLPD
jgi:hypothetical protein